MSRLDLRAVDAGVGRVVGNWETGTLSELVLLLCLAPQVDFDDAVHEVAVANRIQCHGKQRALN